MSAKPARPGSTNGAGYIRGGGGVAVDVRRLLRVGIVICLAGLVAATIILAVYATNQNNQRTELQSHGVPVEATVVGCLGVGSGTGATVYNYSCRASYALSGHTYQAVIKGTSSVYPVGQHLPAVAVPGHPGLLATTAAVASESATWTSYIGTIVVGGLAVALAAAMAGWYVIRRRHGGSSKEASSAALRTP